MQAAGGTPTHKSHVRCWLQRGLEKLEAGEDVQGRRPAGWRDAGGGQRMGSGFRRGGDVRRRSVRSGAWWYMNSGEGRLVVGSGCLDKAGGCCRRGGCGGCREGPAPAHKMNHSRCTRSMTPPPVAMPRFKRSYSGGTPHCRGESGTSQRGRATELGVPAAARRAAPPAAAQRCAAAARLLSSLAAGSPARGWPQT